MASKTLTLRVLIDLPEHHILTAEQPSKLTWELLEATSERVLGRGTLEFRVLDPTLTLRVPLAPARVRIKLWIYFCDLADVACILERRTVDVVNLSSADDKSSLTVPIKITQPA